MLNFCWSRNSAPFCKYSSPTVAKFGQVYTQTEASKVEQPCGKLRWPHTWDRFAAKLSWDRLLVSGRKFKV